MSESRYPLAIVLSLPKTLMIWSFLWFFVSIISFVYKPHLSHRIDLLYAALRIMAFGVTFGLAVLLAGLTCIFKLHPDGATPQSWDQIATNSSLSEVIIDPQADGSVDPDRNGPGRPPIPRVFQRGPTMLATAAFRSEKLLPTAPTRENFRSPSNPELQNWQTYDNVATPPQPTKTQECEMPVPEAAKKDQDPRWEDLPRASTARRTLEDTPTGMEHPEQMQQHTPEPGGSAH
jgi:hypothetical protein